jgi:ferredoxin-thioredoxin reductase catalytic subunit
VPFEVRIGDLVPAEIEDLCRCRRSEEKDEEEEGERELSVHVRPCDHSALDIERDSDVPCEKYREKSADLQYIPGVEKGYQEVPFRRTVTTKIRASVTAATRSATLCCLVIVFQARF